MCFTINDIYLSDKSLSWLSVSLGQCAEDETSEHWCRLAGARCSGRPCLSYSYQLALQTTFHLHFPFCLLRLRRLGFSRPLLLRVFEALLVSSSSYCVSVWGAVSETLRVADKNCLRADYGLQPRTSVSDLYLLSKLLKPSQSYVFRVS